VPVPAYTDYTITSHHLLHLQLLLAALWSGLQDAFKPHCKRCSFCDLPMSFLTAAMVQLLLFTGTETQYSYHFMAALTWHLHSASHRTVFLPT
jgi:hypothetical protein